MAIQLALAPAGYGKTAYAIDAIRSQPPLAAVRVLLPDQVEAAAFRRRLAQAGGGLGVEIYTFYRLYADLLSLAEGPVAESAAARVSRGRARLPVTVRQHLIRYLANQLSLAGQLVYYAPLKNSSGFARLLAELFGELKRARVQPQALAAATAGGEPRLAELAHLYAAYQDWLINTGWVDADGQGWLAAVALQNNPNVWADSALLVVDGFDEFNPTQLHVLSLLAARIPRVLITLTGDPDRPQRLAHRRLVRALAALSNAMAFERVPLEDFAHGPTERALAHLEAHLFEPATTACPAGESVAFVEAQNRAVEARQALRWLKARAVRDGLPLSELALVARDVQPYRPFLEEAASEFGLPLRCVAGQRLAANPAIAALRQALHLTLEPDGWSPRAVLDVLDSPYFDWSAVGLRPGDVERLGEVARQGQVVGGLDQWREAFQRSAGPGVSLATQAGPGELPAAPTPDAANWADDAAAGSDEEDTPPCRSLAGSYLARLADVFEAITARLTPPPQATLRQYIAWIEALIGDDPTLLPPKARDWPDIDSARVVARARENPVTAERDVAALRAFKDILRGLAWAESLLNQSTAPYSYPAFVAELSQAVAEASYRPPVEGEAILLASALEVRGLTFDSVALLGLSEGDFPQAEREDVLLREADRAALKARGLAIEPRLQGDEAGLFYQAATRARRRLLLCRPYLADDGQAWEASPYYAAARALFQAESPRRVRPTDLVNDPASPQELILSAGSPPAGRAAAVMCARAQPAASAWKGDLSVLASHLTERFGPDQAWSSSRLETYAKCPFYFWAMYAMELQPRQPPQAGYNVLILGSIYHLVLEKLYAEVTDGDPACLRARLPLVAQSVYQAAPSTYGFRPTPLWERQQEELTAVLSRSLEGLIENAGDYRPLVQELPFGLRDQPGLVLQNGAGQPGPAAERLQLRGYIDRVDCAPDGRLRVIDYKAGSTPIAARDLTDGYRLQLPLYALAARQALGASVASAFYWHIGSARPSTLILENYPGGIESAIEIATTYALSIAQAVRSGQMTARPPDGGCPTFCPAVTFCEDYRAKSW